MNLSNILPTIISNTGLFFYLITFIIIFLETGAIVLPFLPGDSLLFAVSAMAANSIYNLNIFVIFGIFLLASLLGDSLLGDSLNFLIGEKVSTFFISHHMFSKIINMNNIKKTQNFFKKYGKYSIFIGRFIPIIRTIIPFMVASSNYKYKHFIKYNALACFCWSLLFSLSGYFLGNIPIIKNHFSLVMIGIITLSLIPVLLEILKNKLKKQSKKNLE